MLKRIDGSTLNPDGLAPNSLQLNLRSDGTLNYESTPIDVLGFESIHLTTTVSDGKQATIIVVCYNTDPEKGTRTAFAVQGDENRHSEAKLPHRYVKLVVYCPFVATVEIQTTIKKSSVNETATMSIDKETPNFNAYTYYFCYPPFIPEGNPYGEYIYMRNTKSPPRTYSIRFTGCARLIPNGVPGITVEIYGYQNTPSGNTAPWQPIGDTNLEVVYFGIGATRPYDLGDAVGLIYVDHATEQLRPETIKLPYGTCFKFNCSHFLGDLNQLVYAHFRILALY